MGCIVSLVVVVNLKVNKNDAKLYIGTELFLCCSNFYIASVCSIYQIWMYMSKALHCYLVFHVAVFRKSPELKYWEVIAAVWFFRSYSILKVNFPPFLGGSVPVYINL